MFTCLNLNLKLCVCNVYTDGEAKQIGHWTGCLKRAHETFTFCLWVHMLPQKSSAFWFSSNSSLIQMETGMRHLFHKINTNECTGNQKDKTKEEVKSYLVLTKLGWFSDVKNSDSKGNSEHARFSGTLPCLNSFVQRGNTLAWCHKYQVCLINMGLLPDTVDPLATAGYWISHSKVAMFYAKLDWVISWKYIKTNAILHVSVISDNNLPRIWKLSSHKNNTIHWVLRSMSHSRASAPFLLLLKGNRWHEWSLQLIFYFSKRTCFLLLK